MKVKKSSIPEDSLVNQYMPVDYSDAFCCEISTDHILHPDDIMVNFWLDMPLWVNVLFKLRNFLVSLVGLQGNNNKSIDKLEECIRTGGSYKFMSVPAKDEYETVAFLQDKHLNAWISIRIEAAKPQKVYSITLVRYNNNLGKIYYFIIRPFHAIVVKQMLKHAVSKAILSN